MCATTLAEGGAFSPSESGWAGISELEGLISDSATVLSKPELELSTLRPSDVLWLFAPGPHTPIESIRAFVADGGTLVVLAEPRADNEILERYGIRCHAQNSAASWNLRDNTAWPIAIPNQQHTVTAGVRGVVVNEGCRLQHADLEPFLVFGGDRAPFAYAGGVKSGRVIMLGDASILTNGMLRYRGNHTLADNLIAFAARPRHILTHPGTRWSGYYRDATELDPASRLEHSLQRLAKTRLPHAARAALGMTLLLLLGLPLLVARSNVQNPVERLSHAPRGRSWRNQKGLRLRLEFEDSLRRKLDLPRPFSTPKAVRAMRERGMDQASIERAGALLEQLDRLQRGGASRFAPTLVQLEEMVDTAESILDRIPNP